MVDNPTGENRMADEPQSDDAAPAGDDIQSQDELDALVNDLAALNETPQAEAATAPEPTDTDAVPDGPVSEEQIDQLLAEAAQDTPAAVEATQRVPEQNMTPFTMQSFDDPSGPGVQNKIDMIKDVHLHVRVELGRRKMYIEEILKLGAGSVVELERLAGDPLDIMVNDRLVARGEVLILNDNFCVRVTEIVKSADQERT